jgi:large repetitive protein
LKTQRIEVLASDDISVLRVEFYIDDALFATDTSAPYVVYWNTRRTAPGAYVNKAIAYDASGHSAAAAVTVTR